MSFSSSGARTSPTCCSPARRPGRTNCGSARDRRRPRQTDPQLLTEGIVLVSPGSRTAVRAVGHVVPGWRAGRPAEQVVLESHFDLGFWALPPACQSPRRCCSALRRRRGNAHRRGETGKCRQVDVSESSRSSARRRSSDLVGAPALVGGALPANAPQPERSDFGWIATASSRCGRGRRAGTHRDAEDSSGISRRPCPARCNVARLRGARHQCRVCLPPPLRRYESAQPQYPGSEDRHRRPRARPGEGSRHPPRPRHRPLLGNDGNPPALRPIVHRPRSVGLAACRHSQRDRGTWVFRHGESARPESQLPRTAGRGSVRDCRYRPRCALPGPANARRANDLSAGGAGDRSDHERLCPGARRRRCDTAGPFDPRQRRRDRPGRVRLGD